MKLVVFLLLTFTWTPLLQAQSLTRDSIVAKLLRKNNNTDTAFDQLQTALLHAQQTKNKSAEANLYLEIAKLWVQKKSLYEEAKCYLDTAKRIAEKNNLPLLTGQIDLCYGDILTHQNKFGEAIQIFESCLQSFSNIKDVAGLVTTYKFLGNVESHLDNSTDAIKYYNKGIRLSVENNYNTLLPVLNQNIGNVYLDINGDSAKFYLEKAIQLAQTLNDEHVQALATYNLSEYYSNKNKYDESRARKYEALAIFTKLDETNNVSWVLPQIVKLELNEIKKNRKPLSKEQSNNLVGLLNRALALNADGNSYVNLESIYNSYYTIAQLNNDYQMASAYQAKLIALKDTVYKNQRLKDAIETAERLKTTEQKLKIAKLEVANTKGRIFNYSLIALFIGSLIAAVALYQNYRKRSKRKSEQMLLEQKDQFRNQLAADLHDEVGTMLTGLAMQSEMLSFKADEHKAKELQEISSISKEAMEQMREIVWTLDSSKDKYENLFKRMKYLAEQQLHIKQIEHSFTIQSYAVGIEILPEKRQNVYLIFKEAIANILKHSNATFVTISIHQTKDNTTLLVKDNGSMQGLKLTDGIGINNMYKRAKVIDAALSFRQHDGFELQLIF